MSTEAVNETIVSEPEALVETEISVPESQVPEPEAKAEPVETSEPVETPADSAVAEPTQPVPTLSKEQKIEQILDLKAKISLLISNIRDTKVVCDKYENENQYLQDYVGSLMKSGELK